VTSRTPDVFDEHYYRNAFEMEYDATHYDSYSRTGPKIFVGEWATREGQPTTNMNAALGDAAWMSGMERNSDLVVMSCYAPLFRQRESRRHAVEKRPRRLRRHHQLRLTLLLRAEDVQPVPWRCGLPSPRKIFRRRPGSHRLRRTSRAPAPRQVPTIFSVATKASDKWKIYLKVVNTLGTAQAVKVEIGGAKHIAPGGTAITLSSAKRDDTNSITEPTKIVR